MRLEEAASIFIALALFTLIVAALGLTYWDSLLRPVIELTGAIIFSLSHPFIAAVAVVSVGLLLYRIYRP